MEQADLILLLLNQSEALHSVDRELLELTRDQARIILINKQDLTPVLTMTDLADYCDPEEVIMTSMLTEAGIQALEDRIEQQFLAGQLESTDINYLLNTRHTQLLRQAISALDEVIDACQMQLPVDLIQIDFTRAWNLLGEITGESVQDELLDKLFSRFCLGK